jgi:hypothetical protein
MTLFRYFILILISILYSLVTFFFFFFSESSNLIVLLCCILFISDRFQHDMMIFVSTRETVQLRIYFFYLDWLFSLHGSISRSCGHGAFDQTHLLRIPKTPKKKTLWKTSTATKQITNSFAQIFNIHNDDESIINDSGCMDSVLSRFPSFFFSLVQVNSIS